LLRTLKRVAATGFATAVMFATVAGPASAQPIVTGGLVNITITDVANNVLRDADVALGVAIGVAANVCDVNVAVLATQIDTGTATCTNRDNGTSVTITQTR
jgi:hypothetical protein